MDRRYKMIEKKIKWLEDKMKERVGDNQKFYTRVINDTSIIFSQKELVILSRGLKCNLHYKDKHWIKSLALEAETAISKLNPTEQELIRYQVAQNILNLYKEYTNKKIYNIKKDTNERLTCNGVRHKLLINSVVVIKADKGSTSVVINISKCL